MAGRWAPPAGLFLLLLLAALVPARADKPARAGRKEADSEPEPSSAVFQLYGNVYPHGYGLLPPGPIGRVSPIPFFFPE
jgi:hypothetical protein